MARAVGSKSRELVVGSIGLSNATYHFPALINSVLATKIKIVSGYRSGNEIYKAMEANERREVVMRL